MTYDELIEAAQQRAFDPHSTPIDRGVLSAAYAFIAYVMDKHEQARLDREARTVEARVDRATREAIARSNRVAERG